jgi:hypothetical protein
VNANYDVLIDLLGLALAPAGLALVRFAEHLVKGAVKAAWEPLVKKLTVTPPVPGFCTSVQINQDAGANVNFNFRPV